LARVLKMGRSNGFQRSCKKTLKGLGIRKDLRLANAGGMF